MKELLPHKQNDSALIGHRLVIHEKYANDKGIHFKLQ
jgi:hypothetical protein